MKREFLQGLKVGEQPLTKEVIEAIMEEYGKGIAAEKAKYSDYETLKENLKNAQEALESAKKDGATIEEAKKAAEEWQQKYNKAMEDHKAEAEAREFDGAIEAALGKAKGKNSKAIKALLDLEALKASKNREQDISAAVEKLKAENGYLFDAEGTPPPYAGGTGSGGMGRKYTNDELEKMTMSEYKAYRAGKV